MRFLSTTLAFLGLLTTGWAMESVLPEEVGLSTAKLEAITQKLSELVDQNKIPGAAFMVTRSGKWVYYGVTGYQDKQLRIPMKLDTICRLMSQSKPLGAAAVMKAVEDGYIKLDDPLSKYLPEWGDVKVFVRQNPDGQIITEKPKKAITIKMLLTHTTGLSYGFGFGNMSVVDTMYPAQWDIVRMNPDEFSQRIAQVPLMYQPETQWRYSYSYDILGVVVEKATGIPADQWMKKMIFDPVKMIDSGFYVPSEKIGRYATTYRKTETNPMGQLFRPRIDYVAYRKPQFTSYGAGIVSTARDYARFGQMLLNGGELDGVRVLKSETVDLMWQNYLPKELLPMRMEGWESNPQTGFGFSFTIASPTPSIFDVDWSKAKGDKKVGSIGWGGGANTNFQVSAEEDFVVTYMTQIMGGADEVFQEVVVSGLRAAIIAGSPRKDAGGIHTYTGNAGQDKLPAGGRANGGPFGFGLRGFFG